MGGKGDRLQQIIQKYDAVLAGAEDETIDRVSNALEAAYKQLERELLKAYNTHSENKSLLPAQRKLLILSEVSELLSLVNNRNGGQIQQDLENLLRGATASGETLANELMQAIANEQLQSFASVPLEAVRFQAEDGVKRLSRHSEDFRNRASAIVELGLVQGWGSQRVATALRGELGITKGRAERIARTESLSAHNDAIQANLKRNGFEAFQFWATVDDRVCPYCSARNQQVYKLGESKPPLHPRCRCIAVPYRQSWADLGLIDQEYSTKFRDDAIAELRSTGKDLDNGVAPFEKAAGLTKPPQPIWTPGDRPTSLQSLMKVGREQIEKLGKNPTLEQLKQLRTELLGNGLPLEEAQNLTYESSLTDEAEAAAAPYGGENHFEKVLTEFHQLTAGNVKNFEGFVYAGSRADANLNRRVINVGDSPDEYILFHELGHFLEADNPELVKAAQQWRDAKATGPQQPLTQLTGKNYDATEVALPDHFVEPYVGKVYADGLTEVISVGMEHFATVEGMKVLLSEDPDHFAFVIGVIEAAQQQRLSGAGGDLQGQPRSEPLFMDWYSSHRPPTPVEEAMQRSQVQKSQQEQAEEFAKYLKREEESIRRRTSGEIDRQLREYYDQEAAELRKRLGIPEPKTKPSTSPSTPAQKASDELTLKPVTPELEPIPIKDDLDGITPANETEQRAIVVAREYRAIVSEANEALGKIPADDRTLPPDAYERIYGAINGLMDRLKGTINEAKSLTGKTQNPVLEQYLTTIASASKEALPGYQIRSVNAEIEKKAEVRPC